MQENKKPTVGRPSQKDKEVLLIQVRYPDGRKSNNKTFRATTFDFDKVVDGVKELIKE